MDDRQKAVIKYVEDLLKSIRQGKIEVREMEIVPHMQQVSDEVMVHTIPSDTFTLRILYKEK